MLPSIISHGARGALLVVVASVLATSTDAVEYHVDLQADNKVRFVSDAPIEDFDGVTDHIDGYVLFQGDSLEATVPAEGSELYFEVDLASLDTGIGLRNRHMREDYLHTEDFPFARYTGAIKSIEPHPEQGYLVYTTGTFDIHGISKEREFECTVTREGEGYRVITEFVVALTDHDIEIPSFMFLKISEDIVVTLDVVVGPPAEQ